MINIAIFGYDFQHYKTTNLIRDTLIKKHNLKHVVGDVFANDTSIPDASWISSFILKNVKHTYF